jgi:hypothetical protein
MGVNGTDESESNVFTKRGKCEFRKTTEVKDISEAILSVSKGDVEEGFGEGNQAKNSEENSGR